uniref:ATP-binding protein n=1 Tax=Calothrix sp. 336/3 TaxID=1337936 RepID=UPI001EDF638C|nr:ATP-binding protein [Calothrix sp. 336/3]
MQNWVADILPPTFSEICNEDLDLESTLKELPLYNFQLESTCSGRLLAEFFDKYPFLPGVILVEEGNYLGMLSRCRLLEFMIRPYGKELFLNKPLSIIYSYSRTPILQLSEKTKILTAMQFALRRSPELSLEPIVVKTASNNYKILSIPELNTASWQIRGIETQVRFERSQAQMLRNERMVSLGRLVDGIAHEILDPVSFIWGNLTYVDNYSQDLLKLINTYEQEIPNKTNRINHLKEEIEFDFLEADLSQALASIRKGADRLKKLVTSLQNFCHIDEVHPKPGDIHACIDNIILLINSRIKGEIQIICDYGHLPPVYCFMGQLHQVFMNILSLAVDILLDDAVRKQFNSEIKCSPVQPCIQITTSVISQGLSSTNNSDSRWVSIRISDNSRGMSDELKEKIINSFSTQNTVDKENSLAMSYRIITGRHGGKLNFSSQLDTGTEFEILLPLCN